MMIKKIFAAATIAFSCASVSAQVQYSQQSRTIAQVNSAANVEANCKQGKARINDQVRVLGKLLSGNGALASWDRILMSLEDIQGPLDLIANVHPDKSVRDAAEKCGLELISLSTELLQDPLLYRNIVAAKTANDIEKRFQRDVLDAFEDTGVSLEPTKRARMKAILEKLEALRQDFERNVRDDKTTATFTAKELDGLSEKFLQDQAKSKNAEGAFALALDNTVYQPFMQSVNNEDARKRMYIAKQNQGGQKNIELLGEISKLRLELAKLFGLKDFAEYTLRRRMAKNSETVESFLAGVQKGLKEAEGRELADLLLEKSKIIDKEARDTKVERWDAPYLQERIKKARYSVDQEALRKYFPTNASLQFMLKVSQTIYGIEFVEKTAPVWHKDVRYLEVREANDKRYLGAIYLDLYPRDGKYNHAAVWPIKGVSLRAQRVPIAALVTNFNRDGLNHDELETMFHEFGHALHVVLSKTQFNAHAGTNVKRDFVEAPSQMFEEWVRREESLKLMKDVCPTCPQLNSEQIKKIDEARKFGRGIRYARQHQYARFDMALVDSQIKDPLATWKAIEDSSTMGHVDGTKFPASFGHIAGGYAAGYYGYMWSEVLALDMLSAFDKNILDPQIGRRYRTHILERGAEDDPNVMVERFLGRKADSKAFFSEINGTR